MTDNKQLFRIIQTIDADSEKRTVEFIIDYARQHILLQISENDNRVLLVALRKQTSSESDTDQHYRFTVEIERFAQGYDKRIKAEINDYSGKDFDWFNVPDNILLSEINRYTIEAFVNEFVRDVLSLVTSNITVKREEK
jgi:hypothetical protein